jgi:hypothetical protein
MVVVVGVAAGVLVADAKVVALVGPPGSAVPGVGRPGAVAGLLGGPARAPDLDNQGGGVACSRCSTLHVVPWQQQESSSSGLGTSSYCCSFLEPFVNTVTTS